MSLTLTSPAFAPGDPIPAEYTADGRDVSPPLAWAGVPEGTKALALIADDPDAPDPAAPKRVWVHWVLYNLPPGLDGLPAGLTEGQLPPGTLEGVNDWERTGYGGPNPPVGRHRYFFKLYALDAPLPDLGKPTKTALVAAIAGHVLDRAELVGTYEKT
jgi:Raf kinase inhibitor-like YbhB/YbcL family protein